MAYESSSRPYIVDITRPARPGSLKEVRDWLDGMGWPVGHWSFVRIRLPEHLAADGSPNHYRYSFVDQDSALLFKLAWGGV